MTDPVDRFAHSLGFGAEAVPGGHRFRLWAPDRRQVGLVDAGRDKVLPMARERGGWFVLETDMLRPGDAYLYELDGEQRVPDPASRAQAEDVHGPSLLVDPLAYRWRHPHWRGRPWAEAVVSEVHVGTVPPEGSFDGLRRRLSHFVETGITAVELMPVADFSGRRGWGYDGVLPFAPDRAYGGPDELKRLVDEAHGHGLMVLLDVVYNHFGPDGNYLHAYAAPFFDADRHTPWGPGIDFARPEVREFFIQNALYWLQEYRFDGLRFDAVNQIVDTGDEHFLQEMARRIRAAIPDREIHLVLENDDNAAHLLARDDGGAPVLFTAQWNDDYHHAAHSALTGESDGYYRDYADDPAGRLARGLAEGFIYQGEPSPYREGERRGEPSAGLPPGAFVNFIQNHDQVGNRALGERLTALVPPQRVSAALQLLLLAPQVPLLFMGEEWGEDRPFLYFCDFHGELGAAVRNGRRQEFRRFAQFASEAAQEKIPDPNTEQTFHASRLDWGRQDTPPYAGRAALVRRLLQIRAQQIVPLLSRIGGGAGRADSGDGVIGAEWQVEGGGALRTIANLSDRTYEGRRAAGLLGRGRHLLWPADEAALRDGELAPWTVVWLLADGGA